VGLVQRVIERAGISTISLSNIAALTASTGAPRVAAIEHPGSQPLGPPDDAERQRAVLTAALEALAGITEPGALVHLPFTWPRGAPRGRLRRPPPIATTIMKRPWLLRRLISGDIPKR
jgi:D-proline reductase (dithiol) PrdB